MTERRVRRGKFLSPPSLVGFAAGWTAHDAQDLQTSIDKYRIE